MTSRLDRLFILLESGSSSVTRTAAAKQIGEVQKLHPHELHNLLNRLLVYLQSASWDTRIAAAQAIESILNHVPKWNPQPSSSIKNEKCTNLYQCENEAGRLSFSNFDLEKVLDKGARLMGSEGTEFDIQEETEVDNKEHLIKQRALLNEKLGLSKSNNLGITLDDIVTLDDMKVEQSSNNEIQRLMIPVQDILNFDNNNCVNKQGGGDSTSISSRQSLSCRERNRAKRMARQNTINATTGTINVVPLNRSTSSSSSCTTTTSDAGEPEKKKLKIEMSSKIECGVNNNTTTDPVPDATGNWGDAIDWPLDSFCSKLYIDLFSPRWETRHGSATALRELLKSHSEGAGKSVFMTKDEMDYNHMIWLEDAVLRLLCVLSLDRFGDFLSDQVVAPVRETSAQVLGAILKQMPLDKVEKTINVLLLLIKQKDWEVRHGGLLGIKYLLVVREDLMQTFLPIIINDILSGLLDTVDDVGAVAAATLIPISSWLPKLLTSTQVSQIVRMLWDLLLDQDELTSACNSFMGLLAAILCLPDAATWIEMESMSDLIPRLWPFLSHSTSSVRRSTLQTLKSLTQSSTNVHNNSDSNNSTTNKFKFGVKDWPTELLQDAFRHVYQRVLIEHIEDIQDLAVDVWNNIVINAELSALLHATCPLVATWLCLAMQPARLAFDPASIITSKVQRKATFDHSNNTSQLLCQKLYLGGTETTPLDLREKNVTKARCKTSQMLGLLSKYLVLPDPGIIYTSEIESPIDRYTLVLIGYLNSRSALQRLISSMVIAHWAIFDMNIRPGPPQLQEKLSKCQLEYIYYDEVAVSFTSLLQKSCDFLATLKQYKIPIIEFDNCKVLTLDQIHLLSTTMTENLKTKHSLKPKIADLIDDRRKNLQNSFTSTSHDQNAWNISVQSALAGASVCIHSLPEKLNPVIKPLMESIKREECQELQKLSAKYLVHLLDQIRSRNPCPNNKIITNICRLLKSDAEFTPKIHFTTTHTSKQVDVTNTSITNPYHGIITLLNRQRTNESQNNNGNVTRGPGRPPLVNNTDETDEIEDPFQKQNQIQRTGATFAITAICIYFGSELKLKLPIVWEIMTEHIENNFNAQKIADLENEIINQDETNDLMTSLQLIEIACPHIHKFLEDDILTLLPKLCLLLCHPLKAIRHLTSRCLATISLINTSKIMDLVIEKVLPLLATIENVIHRQGAAETIACIVNKLQFKIVPYVVLLVVPLLGRMSDHNQSVRLMSTQCFATLIQLMPLDGCTPDLPELSRELQIQKVKDKKFLDYLFSPKTIPDFKIKFPLNAELRSYQQAGINWLWFLNKYKLHGILCDDMGLGKTLQTICILAGDHYQRTTENLTSLPSLVICPPTLTGHWVYEVNKFLPDKCLKPLRYVGLPVDRERLREKINSYSLVIASYDIVRKDIAYFGNMNWNYCVLDEGHIIKNGKTKSSKAIKKIIANHRLILSGTPIQNNVLELWSLFDFLMPGFLGTEKQFMIRFSRPILASRDARSSPKEQEAGALAMEGLHRQVLPFLLRRVKEDVLTDLPPKITQDLLCELSPIQERLYEDLSKKQLNSEIINCIENIDGQNLNKKTHVFQALRYLQNVCNHPKLVLNMHHPEFKKIQTELANKNSSLNDIEHSGKLPALKQLLLDCGIGVDGASVNQHRALIFCQLKAMLDIIENDLLKKHLPAVSYLRLDGSVPTASRHDIVTKFNGDPSIDVLLLTTQVGGLGLNLTGADTVIFVEHDWNPMKDLQAMDRAHRIGQKKVVNVYRLITRKSLEEKIMGLQKFKLITANTIVSDENASMETMGTHQLLDLFDLNENQKQAKTSSNNSESSGGGGTTIKQVLENLPELWDDKQYEEEYDLSQFLQKLK